MWGSEKVPEAVVVAIYATTTASGTCETYENIIKYKKRSILFVGVIPHHERKHLLYP